MLSSAKNRSVEFIGWNETDDCVFEIVSRTKRHPSGDATVLAGGYGPWARLAIPCSLLRRSLTLHPRPMSA